MALSLVSSQALARHNGSPAALQGEALQSLICFVSPGGLRRTMSETKGLALASGGPGRSCPPPLHFTSAPSPSSGEPVTPTNKLGRRSFWDMLVMLLQEQGL